MLPSYPEYSFLLVDPGQSWEAATVYLGFQPWTEPLSDSSPIIATIWAQVSIHTAVKYHNVCSLNGVTSLLDADIILMALENL